MTYVICYVGVKQQMKFFFSLKTTTIIAFLIISSFTATTLNAKAESTSQWQLTINGLVEHPLNLTVDDLKLMPQTTEEATIFCVDFPTQIVTTGTWTGVSLATLLEQAGVNPSAVKVAFFAADQYATDLDLPSATNRAVMIAYAKDGVSLSETLRLVVPGRWGYKWISQLTTITLVDYDFKGKWESQGYSDGAFIDSSTSAKPQNLPAFVNPNQPNTTTVPSSSPQPFNVSAAVPAQNTEASKPENEPTTPITPWALLEISAVASAIAFTALLVFVRRRHRLKATN